jgi:hypothetical protein
MLSNQSADSQQFRLYPRGFLGANINSQTERTPKPFTGVLKMTQYTVNDKKSSKGGPPANPHVEALYAQYIKKNPSWGSFDFRKETLLTALGAFGTRSFRSWYLSQHQSPACGDLHNRFLTDTLRYINEGRREMGLMTWGSLITMTDEGNSVGPVSEYAKNLFKHDFGNSLTSVIQKWISHDGGLEDMLGTLHILFGNA